MKVYQLAAHGKMITFENTYGMHSHKVYRTEEQARAAIPGFAKLVTTPKNEQDLMVLEKKGLRISIVPLELMNKKKETKNGNAKK